MQRFFQDEEPERDFRKLFTFNSRCTSGTKSGNIYFHPNQSLGYKVHSRRGLLCCLSNNNNNDDSEKKKFRILLSPPKFLLAFVTKYFTSCFTSLSLRRHFGSNCIYETNLNKIQFFFFCQSYSWERRTIATEPSKRYTQEPFG